MHRSASRSHQAAEVQLLQRDRWALQSNQLQSLALALRSSLRGKSHSQVTAQCRSHAQRYAATLLFTRQTGITGTAQVLLRSWRTVTARPQTIAMFTASIQRVHMMTAAGLAMHAACQLWGQVQDVHNVNCAGPALQDRSNMDSSCAAPSSGHQLVDASNLGSRKLSAVGQQHPMPSSTAAHETCADFNCTSAHAVRPRLASGHEQQHRGVKCTEPAVVHSSSGRANDYLPWGSVRSQC